MVYQKILVALDRSSYTESVFTQALAIAKQDQASLILFHCLPIEHSITPYSNLYGEELLNFSATLREQLEKEKQEIETWLTEYSQKAQAQGVSAQWDWKMGEAGRILCDVAKAEKVDLVVIGRRGLRGIAEVFLGSVSNYVLHHVPCSVLVVQGK
jgi:nucleotide-binding universal stress UspA family protein